MTFEDFQATRTFCHDLSQVDGIGDLYRKGTPGFVYDGDLVIQISRYAEQPPFFVEIEGQTIALHDLEKLERELHAWAQTANGETA